MIAAKLACRSDETPTVLRKRITSKGGTTYAALTTLDAREVKGSFVDAMLAAQARAGGRVRAGRILPLNLEGSLNSAEDILRQ